MRTRTSEFDSIKLWIYVVEKLKRSSRILDVILSHKI